MADSIAGLKGEELSIDLKVEPQADTHFHVGRLLTVDRIVRTPQEKRRLGEQHTALAADMESLAVAKVCSREKVRCLGIRIISDTVDEELPKDLDRMIAKRSFAGRLGAATGAVLRRPSSIKDLWMLRERALVASDRLGSFLQGAILQLPPRRADPG